MNTGTIKAYHFVADKLRDGRDIPKDGELLKHGGRLDICHSGLHASLKVTDALQYAPGNTLCYVELKHFNDFGHTDKLVAMERTILWRIDTTEILKAFARRVALDVAHLWDAPEVVLEYLKTGNESLRDAARSAAWSAAWSAADAADAAWSAARSAADAAARSAARYAAMSAANAARYDDDDGWYDDGWYTAKAKQEEILINLTNEAKK